MFNYSVKVYPIQNPKGKQLAFADITVEDLLTVKGFKVFEGSNGLFAKVPDQKGAEKEGVAQYYPTVTFNETKEGDEKQGPAQKEILAAIVEAYKEATTDNSRGKAAAANAAGPKGKDAPKDSKQGTKRGW